MQSCLKRSSKFVNLQYISLAKSFLYLWCDIVITRASGQTRVRVICKLDSFLPNIILISTYQSTTSNKFKLLTFFLRIPNFRQTQQRVSKQSFLLHLRKKKKKEQIWIITKLSTSHQKLILRKFIPTLLAWITRIVYKILKMTEWWIRIKRNIRNCSNYLSIIISQTSLTIRATDIRRIAKTWKRFLGGNINYARREAFYRR